MSDHPLTRRGNLKLLRLTKAISQKTGVPVEEITGRSRRAPIVQARWLCWYWARQMYGYTLTRIAAAYGVDHTSVSHALQQLKQRREA